MAPKIMTPRLSIEHWLGWRCLITLCHRGQPMCDFPSFPSLCIWKFVLLSWLEQIVFYTSRSKPFVHTDCSKKKGGGYIHPSTPVLTTVAMRLLHGLNASASSDLAGQRHDLRPDFSPLKSQAWTHFNTHRYSCQHRVYVLPVCNLAGAFHALWAHSNF